MTWRQGQSIREMMLDEVIFEVSSHVVWSPIWVETYMFVLPEVGSSNIWPPVQLIGRAVEEYRRLLKRTLDSLCTPVLSVNWVEDCVKVATPPAIQVVPRDEFFTRGFRDGANVPRKILPIERWAERLLTLRDIEVLVLRYAEKLRRVLEDASYWRSLGLPTKQDWSPRGRRGPRAPGDVL